MPGKPKFNSFGKLGEFLKKQELEAAGKKMVDASKNTAKGSRAKIKTGVVKQVPPKVSKVAVLKETPVELPEFKPYYINGENPNILTPEQQALKADLVKSNQIALANYQRELANRGINTPASHRRVGALAVATNPNAIMAPPEGMYKPTYNSATQEWEGAPLREWFEMASNEILPYGTNSLWRKWEQPLKDATNSWDIIGQLPSPGAPASEMSLDQLGSGLKYMKLYLGPNGTSVTPPSYKVYDWKKLKKQGGILSAKSGIHIKKANRGKFTDYCGGKVTSACIAKGKASSNPTIRKRATFAANARKWKHQNGGKIMPYWVYNMLGGE